MEVNDHRPLRIVVIGANGGIGKNVVEVALSAGLHVTAVLRSPSKFTLIHKNLTIVQGDILKPGTLDALIHNQDAIVSAIGSNSLKETVLYSTGAQNILASMKNSGLKRAVFISASGLFVNPTHSFLVRFVTRQILQRILKNMYDDLERMERTIKESDADWTIVRPPRLTDDALTGKYRVAINTILKNPMTISRGDVAHYIINHLMDEATTKATVEIAY